VTLNGGAEAPEVTPPSPYCTGETIAPLEANGTGTITWYSNEALTEVVETGLSFDPGALTETTSFWVQAENNGCASPAVQVTVEVIEQPTARIEAPEGNCTPSNLQAIVSPETVNLQWQLNGQPISGATETSYNASEAGTYQLIATNENCETRSEEIVILETPETPNFDGETIFCEGTLVENLQASSNGVIHWYTNAELSEQVHTDSNYSPGLLSENTSYLLVTSGKRWMYKRDHPN